MEKIVLWGTGKIADKLLPVINDEVVLVIDNDEKRWGTVWNGYVVNRPAVIKDFYENFDRIVIATLRWKEIWQQICREFCIAPSMVDNMYYRQKKYLLDYYAQTADLDKKKYIDYLKKNPLEVFNDLFGQKYLNLNPRVYFEDDKKLYFLYHNNKKMYFSSKFTTAEQVRRHYTFLCMEQDIVSPHRYQTDKFHVCPHDIVLDAGVAEGNFALDIIDLVDKLYLVECDVEWIKALRYTFEPYKDKVEIIEGILGNGVEGSKTIDSIVGSNKIDFIKMDIEGAEKEALCGAKQSLKRNNVKLDICVYHNVDDEKRVRKLLEELGYETEVSDGYMVFITGQFLEKEMISPKLVRGLVRGRKRVK